MSISSSGNLPTPLSVFIGREREITEVLHLLSEHRLVTLTGTGGSGKTRLSLKVTDELAGKFKQGARFMEFASITDPLLIPQAVASALGIREGQKRSLVDQLIDHLYSRHMLLVFDNCEHLVGACAQLSERLLQACGSLCILATSREPLGIPSEVIWTVPPLSVPDLQPWRDPRSGKSAIPNYQESEAVQLFVNRAKLVVPEFSLTIDNGARVAEICRRLDGLPLAIELAAARIRALSVQQLAERLDDRFHLLKGGSRNAPPRQQTLEATIDWSYALLSSVERAVLQRLSVFLGGVTLEAAEAVCSGGEVKPAEVLDALAHLVDKSLVTVNRPELGEMRYHLLETIRQYALEKLSQSGELDESKDRHLNYFIQWAEKAEPYLIGTEQLQWLELYEADHDNLRAALEWCNVDERSAEPGLRLAAACGRFWRSHGYISEGRMRLSSALSKVGIQEQTITRARVLTHIANHAYLQSDYPAMRPLAEEALSIWRELGEDGKVGAAETLELLGELATEEGDYESAPRLFQEALEIYKETNNMRGIGQIYMQLGWAAMRTGELRQAESHLEQFLTLAQQVGDQLSLAFAFSGLGEVAVRLGEYERAISLLEQGLALNRERGNKWGTGTLLGSLGWVALRQRHFKRMRETLGESLAVRMEISDKGGIAWCLEKFAEAEYLEKHYEKSVEIFGAASALRSPINSVIDPADQPDYNRIISDLQSALGKEAFDSVWASGESASIASVILDVSTEPSDAKRSLQAEKEKFGGLTAREREVAVLIAQGKSNREIAEAMTIGVKTVETYVTRILNKLGFDSRVQIATWAVEKGLR